MIFILTPCIFIIGFYAGYTLNSYVRRPKSQYTNSRVRSPDTSAREYLATAVGGFCGGVALGLIWLIFLRR